MSEIEDDGGLPFREWPKIARWNRDVTITEKIDGSNACVVVSDDLLTVAAQSRSRVITPKTDNHGFAAWVEENEETLATTLGPGYHFGEWYGSGVQKRGGYGLEKGVKKLALFNAGRWSPLLDPQTEFLDQRPRAERLYEIGLTTVPVLWEGTAETLEGGIAKSMRVLREYGSFVPSAKGNQAVKPEGIIIYHHAGNVSFKVTLEKDNEWKGKP